MEKTSLSTPDGRPVMSILNPYVKRISLDRFLCVLGQRLEDIMMTHGIATNKLAYESGLTQRTIYRYRNGLYMPTLPIINNVAVALGVEFKDLVFWDSYIISENLPDLYETGDSGVYERDVTDLVLTFGQYPYRYVSAMARYNNAEHNKDLIMRSLNWRIRRRGMTMVELADKSGLSRISLYRYLNGDRFPELWLIMNLCKTLEMDFYKLVVVKDYILTT